MASYLLFKINGGHPPSFFSLPIQLTLRQSVAPGRSLGGGSLAQGLEVKAGEETTRGEAMSEAADPPKRYEIATSRSTTWDKEGGINQ